MSEEETWAMIARALVAKTELMAGYTLKELPLHERAAFASGYVLGRLARFEASLIELRATRPDLSDYIDKVLKT